MSLTQLRGCLTQSQLVRSYAHRFRRSAAPYFDSFASSFPLRGRQVRCTSQQCSGAQGSWSATDKWSGLAPGFGTCRLYKRLITSCPTEAVHSLARQHASHCWPRSLAAEIDKLDVSTPSPELIVGLTTASVGTIQGHWSTQLTKGNPTAGLTRPGQVLSDVSSVNPGNVGRRQMPATRIRSRTRVYPGLASLAWSYRVTGQAAFAAPNVSLRLSPMMESSSSSVGAPSMCDLDPQTRMYAA